VSAPEVDFTPAERAAIEAAVSIGDTLEAQRIIVAALGRTELADAGRCGTCSHWQPTYLHYGWKEWDKDLPAQEGERWGHCTLIAFPDYGEVTTQIAYCQDASEYEATLYCRSDFGCTLHEAKP
jgi:hypothetical protein